MDRTHEDIQDELLVLRSQDGDGDALEMLIARWHARLIGLAWRLTTEREAARDIVQEAWLAIVRGLHRLDDPARFRSWAYRIVRNKCTDWMRRRVAHRTMTEQLKNTVSAATDDPPSGSHATDESDRIRHAMTMLPSEQRAILSLYYLDGMGVAEIARTLDVPEGTVKSRLYHARDRLKQALERVES